MYLTHFKTVCIATLLSCVPATLAAPANSLPDENYALKRDTSKYVFAHFMVGIVQNYTVDDWKLDMAYAQEIGIDAFALNNANIDSYTPTQLANAYQAAQEVGFKVFISFDFSYWSNGDEGQISAYMQEYSTHPAQMQYNGGAVVSTFVGDSFNWAPVKANQTAPIFAIPNLQDPAEATNAQTSFDGAFSWYAWPTDGGNSIISGPMTTIWDDKFVTDLAGKPYMAPVSPWFSTHFNSKNWVFICEELITDRWNEMLSLKPQLIEIVTWNDYGESHYIGPWEADHTDDGSSQWAKGFPHDAWRIIMKPYIAAYKSGASSPTVSEDQMVYWYRPTPKDVTCSGDPLGPPNGRDLLADVVFVTTLLTSPATLTVTSGNEAAVTIQVPAGIVTNNFTMGLGTQTFSVSRDGTTLMGGDGGLQITDTCTYYNYNAYTGSFNASGDSSSPPPPTSTPSSGSTSSTAASSGSSTSIVSSSSLSSSTSVSSTSIASTTQTSGTSTSITIQTTSSAQPTSTTPQQSPTSTTSQPSSGQVCTGGTVASGMSGNYLGLCNFCCSYAYCPPGPCVCTASGAPAPTPPATGANGVPLPGEDDSYLGLCSFACDHGYCPDTACTTS